MAHLVAENSGEMHSLVGDSVLIGRSYQNVKPDICVEDARVSREHAIIHCNGSSFDIENLGRNGTLVQKKGGQSQTLSSRDRIALSEGDRITIGDQTFRFEVSLEEEKEEKEETQTTAIVDTLPVGQEECDDSTRPVIFLDGYQDEDLDVVEKVASDDLQADSELFKDRLLKGANSDEGERIHTLFSIINEFSAMSEEGELFEKALALLRNLIPMDHCALLLKGAGRELESVAVYQKNEEEDSSFVSRGVVEKVLNERVGFVVGDVNADELLRRRMSVFLKRIKSVMCAPLQRGEEVLGVCYVDTTTLGESYGQDDLLYLGAYCSLLARSIANLRLAKEAEKAASFSQTLERYFPPKLIKELKGGGVTLGVEKVEVSVLCTDVRRFLSISETMEPGELVEILNEHFSLISDVVDEYEGLVAKFWGDSAMAFWGAPVASERDPMLCVMAAIEIQRKMSEWQNERWPEGGKIPFEIGIGIDVGPTLAGNIGSSKRMEYNLIGNALFTAEGLSSAAAPRQILVSTAMYEKVKDFIPEKERLHLKSKTGFSLECYEIDW
jgi:adenylate cyclase